MKKREKKRGDVRRVRTAHRSMDVTAALLRCALACSAFVVTGGALSISGATSAMPQWLLLIVQTAMTLVFFGFPAWRGLHTMDVDQKSRLNRRALTAGQLMVISATGVLLVCPMTLLENLIRAPFVRMGIMEAAAQTPPGMLFLPMILKSAVLVPICEELFFRGYLFSALREAGVHSVLVLSSLFFALVHGMDTMLLPHFLLGLLLGAMMLRTDSILTAILLHSAYNMTLLLLSFSGLGGMFSSLGFVGGFVRLAGCAAFVVTIKKAYTAPLAQQRFRNGERLTLAQSMLLSFSLAAVFYIPIVIAALNAAGGQK